MKINVLLPVFKKLYRLLIPKHRLIWGLLILLTIGLSMVETMGISAIMPFISIASNPELLDTGIYNKVYSFTGINRKDTFIIYFGIAIIIFYVFRAVYSIIHTYLINRFSMAVNKNLSSRLFMRILSLPYRQYVQKNSGDFIGIINSESRQICNLSINVLQLFTELFTIVLVYALMVAVNWQMTLVLTVILAALALAFLQILVVKSRALGKKRVIASNKSYRILLEAFGNFKFVRLKGNKDELVNNFSDEMQNVARTQIASNTLGVMPKSILESLGFSLLIAVVIYVLVRYNDASVVIPIISMYALALYRILPSMHRMLGNVNNIAYVHHSLDVVNEAVHLPVDDEGKESIAFNEKIYINNVSFNYAGGKNVISDISFSIRKGEKIAITGESGGGKSTLVDLIIGIHKPLSGDITIDNTPLSDANICSWRRKIGYIPQNIYLFDGTVGKNVAYGSDDNEEKIVNALKKANIWDFLLTKEGIQTKVGEGGIQLSGGQQQRIGIARALYNDPEVLVLDEATSALDNETETKIMDEIYHASKTKTLIVIAHRLSTVERCERKIQIENGKIVASI